MAIDYIVTRFVQHNVGGLRRDLATLAADFTYLESHIASTQNSAARFAALGAIGLGTITTLFHESAIAAGTVQKVQAGFETVLRSTKLALDLQKQVREFDIKTPFTYLETAKGAQMLLAAGFRDDLIPAMEAIGNAVISAGGGTDKFIRLLSVMARIKVDRFLHARRIHQFAAAGINVIDILREKLHLTEKDIMNIGRLHLTADQVLPAIIEGFGERFAGGIEKAQNRYLGAVENLKGTTELLLSSIGDTWIDEGVKIVRALTDATRALDEFVKAHPEGVKFTMLATGVGSATVAILGLREAFRFARLAREGLITATTKDIAVEKTKTGVAAAEATAIRRTGDAAAYSAAQKTRSAGAGMRAAGAAGAVEAEVAGAVAGRSVKKKAPELLQKTIRRIESDAAKEMGAIMASSNPENVKIRDIKVLKELTKRKIAQVTEAIGIGAGEGAAAATATAEVAAAATMTPAALAVKNTIMMDELEKQAYREYAARSYHKTGRILSPGGRWKEAEKEVEKLALMARGKRFLGSETGLAMRPWSSPSLMAQERKYMYWKKQLQIAQKGIQEAAYTGANANPLIYNARLSESMMRRYSPEGYTLATGKGVTWGKALGSAGLGAIAGIGLYHDLKEQGMQAWKAGILGTTEGVGAAAAAMFIPGAAIPIAIAEGFRVLFSRHLDKMQAEAERGTQLDAERGVDFTYKNTAEAHYAEATKLMEESNKEREKGHALKAQALRDQAVFEHDFAKAMRKLGEAKDRDESIKAARNKEMAEREESAKRRRLTERQNFELTKDPTAKNPQRYLEGERSLQQIRTRTVSRTQANDGTQTMVFEHQVKMSAPPENVDLRERHFRSSTPFPGTI